MKLYFLYIGLLLLSFTFSFCNNKAKQPENISSDNSIPSLPLSDVDESKQDTMRLSDGGYELSIEKTDSVKFNTLYSKFYKKEKQPVRITNIDSVKSLLKGRVWFNVSDYGDILIEKIKFDSDTVKVIDDSFEGLFVAYYPEYDFLYLEGGHTSDDGYDLKTGENIYTAGNPSTQTISPNRKYRISSVFGGQECSTHIIQKYINGRFIKIGELGDLDYCYFIRSFWEDDNTFYFSVGGYNDESKGFVEHRFYKLSIFK